MAADSAISVEEMRMRLLIKIAAATVLVVCISASSAAFAAGKSGRSADGLSCGFTVPQNASLAARCAAIKRQCGGKFYANACGGRLVSAAN
jgi:hypothetical protein